MTSSEKPKEGTEFETSTILKSVGAFRDGLVQQQRAFLSPDENASPASAVYRETVAAVLGDVIRHLYFTCPEVSYVLPKGIGSEESAIPAHKETKPPTSTT